MNELVSLKSLKIVVIAALFLNYLLPTIALAETNSQIEPQAIALESAEIIKKETESPVILNVVGSALNGSLASQISEITVSPDIQLETVEKSVLLNEQQVEIGLYTVANNQIEIELNRQESFSRWQLTLAVATPNRDFEGTQPWLKTGNQTLDVTLPAPETASGESVEEQEDTPEEVTETTDESANKEGVNGQVTPLVEPASIPNEGNMTPIQTYNGISLLDNIGDVKVPASHSFFPKKTYETDITVSLPDGSSYTIDHQVVTIIPKDQNAIEGSIYYKDVGYYKNKVLDIRVDFSAKNTSKIRVSDLAYYDLFNASTTTYTEATITSHFIDSETGNPVKVSGNITIDNINRAKFLGLDLSDYLQIYAMRESVIIQNEDSDVGNWLFSSIDYKGTPDVRLTMLYDEKEELSFTMRAPRAVNDVNSNFGAGYTPDKSLVNFEVLEATKKGGIVEDSNQVNVLYDVYQDIPYQTVPIGSYSLEDQLNKVLIVRPADVLVANSAGVDVTNKFTVTVDDNNLLKITAKPATIQEESFYNETYIIQISGRLDKSNLAYLELIKDGYVDVPNMIVTKVQGEEPKNSKEGIAKIKVEKSKVVVSYLDESNNPIIPSEVLEDYQGKSYTTVAKEFPTYELVATPANASGKYTDQTQAVTYYYSKKQGGIVTVKHVNDKGKELVVPQTLMGRLGETYQTAAKNITNYVLKTTPTNAKGTFTDKAQEVVYEYEKEAGESVTVKHVDEAGNQLATAVVLKGKLDDPYKTEVTAIADYELIATPANASGFFTKEAQEVVYVYAKVQGAAVTVKHVDDKGKDLIVAEVLNGKLDETYGTKAKNIRHYRLVETPTNAIGVFKKAPQEVKYVYEKLAGESVTVKYVDEFGNMLAPAELLTGKIGDSYETEGKAIADYELVSSPSNASGEFTTEAQEVVYVYTKKSGAAITVKHLDQAGKELLPAETLKGKVGESYLARSKNIPFYLLVSTPENHKGKFTYAEQEVVFVYEKEAGESVTVKYVDESGQEIAQADVLKGKINDPYKTQAKSFTDYELVTTPANAEGNFTQEPQEVVYVYTKKQGAPVTVKHQDEAGKDLLAVAVLTGKLDAPYKTEAKDINKYVLIATPSNATGVFTKAPQEVVYVYEKVQGATVTVKYVNEKGNSISPSDSLQGKLDAPYSTTDKIIPDYELIETPINTSGFYTAEPQEVVYVYTKKQGRPVTVKHVDETGENLLTPQILSGKLDAPYKTTAQNITNYVLVMTPSNASGVFTKESQEVVYVYEKAHGESVTVKFINETGGLIAVSEILTGKIDTPYETKAKEIRDYELVATPGNAAGVFTTEAQEVVYEYQKKQGATVTVKHVDQEGNELLPPETLTGKLDLGYTTSPKNITHYFVTAKPSNFSGTFTTETQEVVYVYEKEVGQSVVVKYVDDLGNDIYRTDVLTGKIGDSYKTTAKNIPDYELLEMPENAKGVFTTEAQEVVYLYTKRTGGQVTIKFVDREGKSLSASKTLLGKMGESYRSAARAIQHYVLVAMPTNAQGAFTYEAQEVVYVYEKAEGGTVTVKYVDEEHHLISQTDILKGKIDEAYLTKVKPLKYYEIVTLPTNAKGTFKPEAQEVVYVYTKKTGADVIVKHVDKAGKDLMPSVALKGKVGEGYQTASKNIRDYLLVLSPQNAQGEFTYEEQVVSYVYEKVAGASVTVKHVDEEGATVSPSRVLKGKLDAPYVTTAREIPDYDLVLTPENAEGLFTKEAQSVVYVYTKKAGAAVTVKHLDQSGKEIAEADVLTGKIGTSYVSAAKNILHYVLVKTPSNGTGEFSYEPQTVTYSYDKAPGASVTVKYVDEAGQMIYPAGVLTGRVTEGYKTIPVVIKDYELVATPANGKGFFTTAPQEVVYGYTKKQGANVVVKYQDATGKELALTETLTGKLGDSYTTVAKNIKDYVLIATPGNAKGTFSYEEQVVVYTYEKVVGGSIAVKYLDEFGQQLFDTTILFGKLDDYYKTTIKKLPDYELLEEPANKNGQFTKESQEVVYVYTKRTAGEVREVHVDLAGKELIRPKILLGKLGESYQTGPKNIKNYVLVSGPTTAAGIFTSDQQVVTYVYEKAEGESVTVKYVDEFGELISHSDILKGKVDEAYETVAKAIPDYEVVSIPSNAKGKFATEAQEVIYVYTKKTAAAITVKHVDQSGKELVKSMTLLGKLGESYQTAAKNIQHYLLVATPSNARGVFSYDKQEVIYVYEKAAGQSVTVKYVDDQGQLIANSDVLAGKIGDAYETKAKELATYQLKETPANTKGVFTTEAQEVVYVYEKKQGGDVTVKHLDQRGKELIPNEVLTGKIDADYMTQAKNILNYVLVATPTNAVGKFRADKQEVVYVYDQAEGGSITVKYVDEFANILSATDVLKGKIGNDYTTTAKAIPDYELVETPANAKGTFTSDAQEVIFLYTKKQGGSITVKHQDTKGKELAKSENLTGKLGESYQTQAQNIANYVLVATPSNAIGVFTHEPQEVLYVYDQAEGGQVTVKYTDEDGRLIAETDRLAGKIGDTYETSAKKIIDYQVVTLPENMTGKFTKDPQEVVYVYTKAVGKAVMVNYVDTKGKELHDSQTLTGKLGQAYETEAVNISGYQLTAVPANAKGVFTKDAQTVTYVYTKQGSNSGNNGQTDNKPDNKPTGNKGSGYVIPQLGGTSNPLLVVAGLSILALVLVISKRRRKQEA